ncbi:MAG: NADH-quinone oxidoreductase subunit N, partial [Planctomycetes bacterium]|nr:NADH-quinone oxidoreductase subunit N [Planctomycetota bacterium]
MLAMTSAIGFGHVLPELILVGAGCAALIAAQASRDAVRRLVPWITLAAIVAGIMIVRGSALFGWTPLTDFEVRGGFRFDPLADYVRIATLTLGVLITLALWTQPSVEERGEFFAMLLFALAGLMLMGAAADLINLFLALELVSIPSYVLVGLGKKDGRSLEASTKYFYLGAVSAAITVYGFSFLYGVAGSVAIDSTSIARIAAALQHSGSLEQVLAAVGVTLSIAGMLFKLSAVPLHFYVADVYQGAASAVAGMLGFVPKLAGILGVLRVLQLAGWTGPASPGVGVFWTLWLVSVLSMTIGNVLALRQTSIKRMLAYSGIAHSGYMLVGLLAATGGASSSSGTTFLSDGAAAALYYVLIYGIANLGAFGLLALLEFRGAPCETVRDIAGLLRRNPGLAVLMALSMFTLMGMPPTPGFWGKLSLFGSALSASDTAGPLRTWVVALVIIAVVNSAVAAAYYLRVIAAVLLYENDDAPEPAPREAQNMGVLLCGFLTLIFAFVPGPVFVQGQQA